MKEGIVLGGFIGLFIVAVLGIAYLMFVAVAWGILAILAALGFDTFGSPWLWGGLAFLIKMLFSNSNVVNIKSK
jgi:hypothetical protein